MAAQGDVLQSRCLTIEVLCSHSYPVQVSFRTVFISFHCCFTDLVWHVIFWRSRSCALISLLLMLHSVWSTHFLSSLSFIVTESFTWCLARRLMIKLSIPLSFPFTFLNRPGSLRGRSCLWGRGFFRGRPFLHGRSIFQLHKRRFVGASAVMDDLRLLVLVSWPVSDLRPLVLFWPLVLGFGCSAFSPEAQLGCSKRQSVNCVGTGRWRNHVVYPYLCFQSVNARIAVERHRAIWWRF